MSYCYWLIHKAYHWKGVKESYKMGYNSYVVHSWFYISSIIESHFVFGQMKWRYRINVSDNYQNKSYHTKKDLSYFYIINCIMNSLFQLWRIPEFRYIHYTSYIVLHRSFDSLCNNDKKLFHVKQIYLTNYIGSLYLAHSLMYDKKSSICKCNVCISITWCMYCLGESGKRVNVISRAQGKNLNGKRKTFYTDGHLKIALIGI